MAKCAKVQREEAVTALIVPSQQLVEHTKRAHLNKSPLLSAQRLAQQRKCSLLHSCATNKPNSRLGVVIELIQP